MVGEFNLPNVDWHNLSSFSPSDQTIFDIAFACDLSQAVNIPTRVQGDSSSILDLVLYSRSLSEVQVSVEDGLSDHKLVSFSCLMGSSDGFVAQKRKTSY